MDGPVLLFNLNNGDEPIDRQADRLSPSAAERFTGRLAGNTLAGFYPASECDLSEGEGSRFGALFTGRLDSASEIRTLASGAPPVGESPAALIAVAFERHGTPVLDRLAGDYYVAVWDKREGRLYLSGTFLGDQTWFYAVSGGTLACACTIRDLLALRLLRPTLDEGYLLGSICYRTSGPLPSDRTAYREIRRLLGGHYLEAKAGPAARVEQRPYWRPDQLGELRRSSLEGYAQAFRKVFTESVDVRIRGADRVHLEVSGGIDSSLNALVARKLVDERYPEKRLVASSFGFDHIKDEREYQRPVIERLRPDDYRRVMIDDMWILKHIERAPVPDEPAAGHLWYEQDYTYHALASHMGVKVSLSGDSGDEICSGEDYLIAWNLRQARFGRAFDILRQEVRKENRNAFKVLLSRGLHPQVPPSWFAALARRSGRLLDNAEFNEQMWCVPGVYPWLNKTKAEECGVYDSVWLSLPYNRIASHPKRRMMLYGLTHNNAGSFLNRTIAGPLGYRKYMPYRDKRVVELMMRIPDRVNDAWVEDRHYTKRVMREAFKDLFPDILKARTTKYPCDTVVKRGLYEVQQVLQSPEKWRLSEMGLIDPHEFEQYLLRGRLGRWKHIFGVVSTIAAEIWLRQLNSK